MRRTSRRTFKRAAIIALVAIGLPVVGLGAWVGFIQLDGNLRTVEEGAVYRSAQLDRAGFERAIKERGIKSILNLRGPNQGSPWYDGEIAVSKELGITHYDYGISARRQVNVERMAEIVAIMRDAPKPILIHCQSGADRSGLVSALYELAVRRKTPDEADRQLSLYYGHFPYLTSRTKAMDQSFWVYVAAKSPD
jgi:protein tyrosine/serine phosphatase